MNRDLLELIFAVNWVSTREPSIQFIRDCNTAFIGWRFTRRFVWSPKSGLRFVMLRPATDAESTVQLSLTSTALIFKQRRLPSLAIVKSVKL